MNAIGFALLVVISVLVIAVLVRAVRSLNKQRVSNDSMPDNLQYPRPDNDRESKNEESFHSLLSFSLLTGIVAIVTNFITSLLAPFGVSLLCCTVPAGLLGILGGFAWYKVKKKSEFAPSDFIPLVLIGFGVGIITYGILVLVYFVFLIGGG